MIKAQYGLTMYDTPRYKKKFTRFQIFYLLLQQTHIPAYLLHFHSFTFSIHIQVLHILCLFLFLSTSAFKWLHTIAKNKQTKKQTKKQWLA